MAVNVIRNFMVSIKDVARSAGVSSATVSRVIGNKPYVSDEIRQRVLQIAAEMGYQPDHTARRLRHQSTSKVVGLVVTDITNPHHSALAGGVEDLAYAEDMSVLLCNTDYTPERHRFYLERMLSERAAGLILTPTFAPPDSRLLAALRAAGVAVVLIDAPVAGHSFDLITVDDRGGAFDAVSHLIARGYERIGIIAGRQTLPTGQNRLAGYFDALRAAGVAPDEALVQIGDFSRASGYRLAGDLLDLPQPPRALFVCNNDMTAGALHALNARGLAIPDEVALVGFDEPPWAEIVRPPLTVVAQPAYEIGREAMRLLLRRIQEPNAAQATLTLPARLIVRASS
jgi:LacI family transcriptional regulator